MSAVVEVEVALLVRDPLTGGARALPVFMAGQVGPLEHRAVYENAVANATGVVVRLVDTTSEHALLGWALLRTHVPLPRGASVDLLLRWTGDGRMEIEANGPAGSLVAEFPEGDPPFEVAPGLSLPEAAVREEQRAAAEHAEAKRRAGAERAVVERRELVTLVAAAVEDGRIRRTRWDELRRRGADDAILAEVSRSAGTRVVIVDPFLPGDATLSQLLAVVTERGPAAELALEDGSLAEWIARYGDPQMGVALHRAKATMNRGTAHAIRVFRWSIGDRVLEDLPGVTGRAGLASNAPAAWDRLVHAWDAGRLVDWVRYALDAPAEADRLAAAAPSEVDLALHRLLWWAGWRGIRFRGTIVEEPIVSTCVTIPEAAWDEAVHRNLVAEWLRSHRKDAPGFVAAVARARTPTGRVADRPSTPPAGPVRAAPERAAPPVSSASSVLPAPPVIPRSDELPKRTGGSSRVFTGFFVLTMLGIIGAGSLWFVLGLLSGSAPATIAPVATPPAVGTPAATTPSIVRWEGTMEDVPFFLDMRATVTGAVYTVEGTSRLDMARGTSIAAVRGTYDPATGRLDLEEDEPRELRALVEAGTLAATPSLPQAKILATWHDGGVAGTWVRAKAVHTFKLRGPALVP